MQRPPRNHAGTGGRYRVPAGGALLAGLLVLSLAAPETVARTTYYVHPGGDDTRDGQTPATAWRTLARVNAARFAPGDHILFARGGEWRERLAASSDGAPGQPIVYAAYGRGPRPRFWGSDLLRNSAFEPVGSGVYRIAVPGKVHAVLVDHRFLRNASVLAGGPGPAGWRRYTDSHPGTWYQDGGRLYLHAGGSDPRTDGRVYTACVRDDVVFTNGKKHLVFRDLVVDESARADAGYAFRVMSDDVLLEGCAAYRAGKHHFGVINSTRFTGKGLYAAYAMPDQGTGGATAYVSYSDLRRKGDTSRYIDCVCEHLENGTSGGVYPAFYTHGEGIGSVSLEGMTCRGCNLVLANGDSGAAIHVRGGRIENAGLEFYGKGMVVDGLALTGPRASVTLDGTENILQNVLLVGSNPGTAGYQAAVVDRGTRNTIRFCTVVLDRAAPEYDAVLSLVRANSGLNWYGNILLSNGKAIRTWFPDFDPSRYRASYNFYRRDAEFDTRFEGRGKLYHLKEWQSRLDAGSIEGDPRFVDPARGNYALSAGSPAIDAARLDRSLLKEVPIDFLGRPRLVGRAYDMGACEFVTGKSGAARPRGRHSHCGQILFDPGDSMGRIHARVLNRAARAGTVQPARGC